MDKISQAIHYGMDRVASDITAVTSEQASLLAADRFADVTPQLKHLQRLMDIRSGFELLASGQSGGQKVVEKTHKLVYANDKNVTYTPQKAYEMPILGVLARSSRPMQPRNILEQLYSSMSLLPGDLMPTGSGRNIRWKSMAYHALYHDLRERRLASKSPSGWSITPEGRAELAKHVATSAQIDR